MRTTLGVFAALLLAGAAYARPADAQTTPQGSNAMTPTQTAPQVQSYGSTRANPDTQAQLPEGSFRSNCNDLRMEGQTLLAFCQRSDGTWQTTAIGPISQCVGDIQNVNGDLRCNETGYGSSTPPAQAAPTPEQPKY